MQKHNRYLVWTIWIATIAFIGAGFVGWGSYDFGKKAGNVAKVGDIEISQAKLNQAYSDLYTRYNEMFQGQFDEKKAKEMGLVQQAFATLETQARLLNYAQAMGVIVSDEELAQTLQSIKGFQKNGKFDRGIYDMFLKNRRMKAKDFEARLREELTINKLLALLNVESLPLEEETIGAALNVADKFKYEVLALADVNPPLDEAKLKAFWEAHKTEFKTAKKYTLSLLWTESADTPVNENELKTFFDTNSFNYIDQNGKQLTFEEAKEKVTKDYKIKKTKKTAQRAYIAFKKGKQDAQESVTLPLNDPSLSKSVWDEIQQHDAGSILKPKVVNTRYVTVKIEKVIEPKVMTFEEAKPLVTKEYEAEAKQKALAALAEEKLKSIDESNATVSDFVTLSDADNLEGLNSQESLQFLQKLFTSLEEKGIIRLSNKVVVYDIMAQKHLSPDANLTERVKETVNTIKPRVFESNLIQVLAEKYPTEVYVGGLKN